MALNFVERMSNKFPERASDLDMLSYPLKKLLGLIIAFSFMWGTAGKIIIYKHCSKFRISERPINILILLDEVIHHVLITYTTLNLLIILLLDQSPLEFIWNVFGIHLNDEVSLKNDQSINTCNFQ